MHRFLSAILAACGVALPLFAQKSPDETVKSMTIADGLQVELFAAEPMLINPTSIDVDHLGRVWVCEAVNYRRVGFKRPILREEGDRIVILTDKDGDGKADDSSVFYQGKDLYGPLGICVLASPVASAPGVPAKFAYRVLVCQSPDILEFWDKDGDGKADGPPKKFLTNFGGFDHDHGVHGINVGPDGKLYFTVGDSGVKGLQSADGKGPKWNSNDTTVQKGTVWRCDMDGNNLELIAHNFRNNYECCVNSFGEIWLSDNDDDGNQQTRICHVMPGGNYGYGPRGPGQSHWHEEQPGIVHKTMRTGFGSPTGICFYEGTLLPKRFHNQLLHTDAGPRELRAFHITPKGAGHTLVKENVVSSTDTWFRPSDVCVAPDGSVMIADWYDPGVGGHGMGDWKMGRIYRVTPKGHKGYKVPEVKLDTKEGTVESLASPCLAARAAAVERLRRSDESFSLGTIKIAVDRKEEPDLFARACLCLLAVCNRTPEELVSGFNAITSCQQSSSDEFRQLAVRLIDQFRQNSPVAKAGIGQETIRIVSKESAAVRREQLLYLGRLPHDEVYGEMFGLFYPLAKLYDGHDIFYRAALNIACGTDPKRREAILADFDKQFPEWNDKVADLFWELRPASSLARLGKLLDDSKLTAAQKGRVVDILAVYDDANAGQTMLALLGREVSPEIKSRAIENLRTFLPTKWKDLQKGEAVRDAISNLLQSKAGQIAGLQLAAAAPDCVRGEDIIRLAGDAKASKEVRIAAVQVLGKTRQRKYVEELHPFVKDPVVGPAAAAALGEFLDGKGDNSGAKDALVILGNLVTKDDAPAEMRQAALSALTGSRTGTGWLLQLKESGNMPSTLVASAGRLLRNSPFQGERNKAMLLFPAAGKLDPKKLPPISELVKRTGDVKRGEALLAASLKSEAQCLRCHTVRGVGGNIGPDQSMIGKKASRENLLESILLPSKAIADQYVQWKVNTLDEKSVVGLLIAETATSITLRDANGKDHTFATKDLDGPKQKSLVSIMPDNLVSALTEDELIDMVEYLLTLKTASITPETWHILGPFANDASDSALDADLGLEKLKAIDLTATLKGRDGEVKWGTVRVTGTGYLDLAAHYGPKGAQSASYLYRVIESPIDQDGMLLIGNDDGAKIWINGEKAFENRDHFAATPERHRVPVKLKKGANTVLIKIVNGDNPHGLYFALTSGEELKLAN
jgi:putative membrane-bound dehydrogenase-like protein